MSIITPDQDPVRVTGFIDFNTPNSPQVEFTLELSPADWAAVRRWTRTPEGQEVGLINLEEYIEENLTPTVNLTEIEGETS